MVISDTVHSNYSGILFAVLQKNRETYLATPFSIQLSWIKLP